jgi:hypothetical protein
MVFIARSPSLARCVTPYRREALQLGKLEAPSCLYIFGRFESQAPQGTDHPGRPAQQAVMAPPSLSLRCILRSSCTTTLPVLPKTLLPSGAYHYYDIIILL